jgi:hypothetical protein
MSQVGERSLEFARRCEEIIAATESGSTTEIEETGSRWRQ